MRRKKSPSTVALLNFFFLGLGYVYLGKYRGWGYFLTALAILIGFGGLTYGLADQALFYAMLLPLDIAFAWHGYKIAQE